ncbi:MAG: hypothetical protein ACYDEP_07845 [Acidimicrobiales bacterium]
MKPPQLDEETILKLYIGTNKGSLVLQSRRPPVAKETSSQGGFGPNRRTDTIANMPIASIASKKGEPPTGRLS